MRKLALQDDWISGDPTLFDVLFLDGPLRTYRDSAGADLQLNGIYNKVFRKEGTSNPLPSYIRRWPSPMLTWIRPARLLRGR